MKVYIIRSTSVYQAYLISRSTSSRSFLLYNDSTPGRRLGVSVPLSLLLSTEGETVILLLNEVSLFLSYSSPNEGAEKDRNERMIHEKGWMNGALTSTTTSNRISFSKERRRERRGTKRGREFRGNIIDGVRAKTRRVLLRARTFRFWPYIARLTTAPISWGGGENSNLRRGIWDYGWDRFQI